MGSKSKHHIWGNPDEDGVRACNRAGCTVRVSDSFRSWQRTKRSHWKRQARELIPACEGGQVPVADAPDIPLSEQVAEDHAKALAGLHMGKIPDGAYVTGDESKAALARLAAGAQRAEAEAHSGDESRRRLLQVMKERDAVVTDNAVLYSDLREASRGLSSPLIARIQFTLDQPHPGAVMLERMGLLEQVARLAADSYRPTLREMARQALGDGPAVITPLDEMRRLAAKGLDAYHGRLCSLARGAHPVNPGECEDETCRSWQKALGAT